MAGLLGAVAVTDFFPDQHRWVQLRADAGTIYFETSADGVVFEVFASLAAPFDLSNVRAGLRASNYQPLQADDVVSYAEAALCTQAGG